MANHQLLSKPDSSPGLVTSFPPQLIQASPQIEPASHSTQTDLKAERERAEQLGHHFSRVKVLSDRPPTDPIQPFQLSIQRQIASQQEHQDTQAEAEQHSSLSEQEKMALISVIQEIREVSLPAADFVSGAVYQ